MVDVDSDFRDLIPGLVGLFALLACLGFSYYQLDIVSVVEESSLPQEDKVEIYITSFVYTMVVFITNFCLWGSVSVLFEIRKGIRRGEVATRRENESAHLSRQAIARLLTKQ